jgi:aryl-alcohol dehydrogenase-like predicted oxidoreductase
MTREWLLPFGSTGFTVSRLGLGAGQIGSAAVSDDEAAHFLNAMLDAGINLIDTARGYGLSEERIGKSLSGRRSEFVLSTKIGYGIEGIDNWTPPILMAGVERALKLMKTDVLDIVHLHSCPLETLTDQDLLRAFEDCKSSGKVKVIAYSGENKELDWAVKSGPFGSIETSVNPFDQWSLNNVLSTAAEKGFGVIAKRPMANMCWTHTQRPAGDYCETYWQRRREMAMPDFGIDMAELALRFTAFAPGVCTSIAGTRSLEHLLANKAAIEKGPLPDEIVSAYQKAFHPDWEGQI